MAPDREELDFLKRVYRNLDPNKPLEPGDTFYHPVYEQADVADPVARLKQEILFSDVQSLQFFSGFRGSGKTTELYRLREALEEDGYIVLYASALEYINPALPIEISDLLVILAGAFGDAVQQWAPTIDVRGESYWTRLVHFLQSTEVELKEFSFGIKDGPSFKISLKETPSFRQRVQGILATRLAELENQTQKFFEDCVIAIRRERPGAQIVFLFDQLEQLRGSRLTDQEVLSSVERLFSQHRDRLHLPSIHVVYTVPPWLKFILPGTPITLIPSVRQWENDAARTQYEPGRACLYQVLVKRFGGEAGLLQFFGKTANVFKLIDLCGGHFRDLLRLAREAVVRSTSSPVPDKVLEASIIEVRSSYLPIAAADAVWLQLIATSRTHGLRTTTPEDVNRFSHFLDTHLVLFLRNGEEWYDIHPLIRVDVEETARLANAANNV
jgi:hypothetical protein